ncbi:MAG: ArsR family transcriptional regulator [Haloarculaceae archaeon]
MSEKEESRDGMDGDAEWSDSRDSGVRPFIDDVFGILADWRRREVCRFFVETDADIASVDDLAILLAGCRPDDARGTPPAHDELVAALEERHLPRLDAAGVVDYDSRSGTVRYWGQPTLEKWLEHVAAVDDRCA